MGAELVAYGVGKQKSVDVRRETCGAKVGGGPVGMTGLCWVWVWGWGWGWGKNKGRIVIRDVGVSNG